MTDAEFKRFPVPKEIEAEVAILVEGLRKNEVEKSGFESRDVTLITPHMRGFGQSELVTLTLSIPTAVLASVSKAWIEKYVTPVIIERLDRPSAKFKKWLRRVFKVS